MAFVRNEKRSRRHGTDLPVAGGVDYRNDHRGGTKRVGMIVPTPPDLVFWEGPLQFLAPLILKVDGGYEDMHEPACGKGVADRHDPDTRLAGTRYGLDYTPMPFRFPGDEGLLLPSVERDRLGGGSRRRRC